MKQIYYVLLQGSISRSLLFIIYINDLPSAVLDISITMHADDTGIGRSFISDTEIKQHRITASCKVYEWLKSKKLSLYTMKTEFMIYGTKNRLNQFNESPVASPYTLCFQNLEIKRAKHAKYLGLIVDDTLTRDKQIEYVSTKINRNIGVLKGAPNYLLKSSLTTLYITLIESCFSIPLLCYCHSGSL